MTYTQTMTALKKMGTAQNVKVYKRHGAGENLFGVSFANLKALAKKIKVDHELALRLWDSGNVDARTLATMVADASAINGALAQRWIKDVDYYLLADCVAGAVAKSPVAEAKMKAWMASKKQYVRQGGYSVLGSSLVNGVDVSVSDCRSYLKTIEKEIHASANRAKHAMIMALIAIGIYKSALTKPALAAAKRIGKVDVDHGETACKTPDAIPYIERAIKRRTAR
jgi:3-methyladenine DNA glycosylase AlkD